MLIQSLTNFFVPNYHQDKAAVRRVALLADWVIAIGLLTVTAIGLLTTGIFSPTVTQICLGAGVVYTFVMLLNSSVEIKIGCKNRASRLI